MTFRHSLEITAAFWSLLICFLHAEQPNVLLIFPDQLQRDVLSCYGGPVPTPHIDRLAKEGLLFSDATCPTPYCAPTRMSLVTALYPQQHGVVQNTGWKQRGMRPDERTYPRVLWEDGYSTHHYGKWHLEYEKKGQTVAWYQDQYRYFPEFYDKMADKFESFKDRGEGKFCDWYGLIFPVELSDELKMALDHNDLWNKWRDHWAGKMVLGMGQLELELEDCYDYQVANRAIATIQKHAEARQPFMINCAFNVPHDPYLVPEMYYDMFPLDEIELPANEEAIHKRFTRDWAREVNVETRGPNGEEYGLLEFMRVYYANVKFLDDQVGRVLEALEASGQMDNTIIAFFSDHGDMAGGHGMTWKETVSFYEEVASIPMIFRYPKRLNPGLCEVPINTVDVFPTIFDMLGRDQLEDVAGKSLLPYMTGEKDVEDAFPYTFSVRISNTPGGERVITPDMAGHFMVRGKGFKYMVYGKLDTPDERYKDEPFDILYHLDSDPGETVDLANNPEFATVKQEMNQVLQDWLKKTGWKGRPVLSYSANR
jgi:arylsulfatase A-like enzyme